MTKNYTIEGRVDFKKNYNVVKITTEDVLRNSKHEHKGIKMKGFIVYHFLSKKRKLVVNIKMIRNGEEIYFKRVVASGTGEIKIGLDHWYDLYGMKLDGNKIEDLDHTIIKVNNTRFRSFEGINKKYKGWKRKKIKKDEELEFKNEDSNQRGYVIVALYIESREAILKKVEKGVTKLFCNGDVAF